MAGFPVHKQIRRANINLGCRKHPYLFLAMGDFPKGYLTEEEIDALTPEELASTPLSWLKGSGDQDSQGIYYTYEAPIIVIGEYWNMDRYWAEYDAWVVRRTKEFEKGKIDQEPLFGHWQVYARDELQLVNFDDAGFFIRPIVISNTYEWFKRITTQTTHELEPVGDCQALIVDSVEGEVSDLPMVGLSVDVTEPTYYDPLYNAGDGYDHYGGLLEGYEDFNPCGALGPNIWSYPRIFMVDKYLDENTPEPPASFIPQLLRIEIEPGNFFDDGTLTLTFNKDLENEEKFTITGSTLVSVLKDRYSEITKALAKKIQCKSRLVHVLPKPYRYYNELKQPTNHDELYYIPMSVLSNDVQDEYLQIFTDYVWDVGVDEEGQEYFNQTDEVARVGFYVRTIKPDHTLIFEYDLNIGTAPEGDIELPYDKNLVFNIEVAQVKQTGQYPLSASNNVLFSNGSYKDVGFPIKIAAISLYDEWKEQTYASGSIVYVHRQKLNSETLEKTEKIYEFYKATRGITENRYVVTVHDLPDEVPQGTLLTLEITSIENILVEYETTEELTPKAEVFENYFNAVVAALSAHSRYEILLIEAVDIGHTNPSFLIKDTVISGDDLPLALEVNKPYVYKEIPTPYIDERWTTYDAKEAVVLNLTRFDFHDLPTQLFLPGKQII